jgi:M6 family metalloprotease-like protein
MEKISLFFRAISLLAFASIFSACSSLLDIDKEQNVKVVIDGGSNINISMADGDTSTSSGSVISPDNVQLMWTKKSLQTSGYYAYDSSFLPSTGSPKVLVLPIKISGGVDPLSDKQLEKLKQAIDTVFNGEDNEYRESVKSFYEKSSYGALNIQFDVLDSRFDASDADSSYTTPSAIFKQSGSIDGIVKIANAAIDQLDIDRAEYDSDKDGFIDAVRLVYDIHNYSNDQSLSDEYWAYVSQTGETANKDKPAVNVFGWASYDFMYAQNNYEYDSDFSKLDAHTFIHETGHMLGLNDYYDYNFDGKNNTGISPLGGVDMMDYNIIDHNSYSKMLLGWTKPYIVTGDADISLASMENEDSLIVIPYKGKKITKSGSKYVFNPFDEYILIELYDPSGLNKNDSDNYYLNESVRGFTKRGFRVYHVDNRLFKYNFSNGYLEYFDDSEELDNTFALIDLISNSSGGSYGENATIDSIEKYNDVKSAITLNDFYSEITMIDRDGEYDYKTLHVFTSNFKRSVIMANNDELFQSEDFFSFSTFSKYFVKGSTLDNGEVFDDDVYFL